MMFGAFVCCNGGLGDGRSTVVPCYIYTSVFSHARQSDSVSGYRIGRSQRVIRSRTHPRTHDARRGRGETRRGENCEEAFRAVEAAWSSNA